MSDIERHTISVLVDNESGVLARVIGLFSGRGYNIESLTVAEVDVTDALSRITVVIAGLPLKNLEQCTSQFFIYVLIINNQLFQKMSAIGRI